LVKRSMTYNVEHPFGVVLVATTDVRGNVSSDGVSGSVSTMRIELSVDVLTPSAFAKLLR